MYTINIVQTISIYTMNIILYYYKGFQLFLNTQINFFSTLLSNSL